jgi:hypothetical protein
MLTRLMTLLSLTRPVLLGGLTLVLLVWSVAAPLHAQTGGVPVPPSYELKVFKRSDGHVFWPMDKPVWVRLATSPEESAQTFLLEVVQESLEEKKSSRTQEGIRLEIPGRQFIRWVNFLTQDETLYRFIADGAPPVTNLRLTNAPIFTTEKRTFYGVGLIGTLISKDDLSGVEEALLSVDGEQYRPYLQPLVLDTEKTFLIRHLAVDNVGYASKPVEVVFTVDLSPPESMHQVTTNFLGDILSRQSVIRLSSLDRLSGVDNIRFYFDDAPPQVYNPELGVEVKDLTDGEHVLYYYATDRVSNVEEVHEYPFTLDIMPPEVTTDILGDLAESGGQQFVSPRTRVQLTAKDGPAQPKMIEYRINETPYTTYVTPFIPRVESGELAIEYRGTDRLGNLSEPGTLNLVMDKNPPQSEHAFSGPNYSQGIGAVWITSETEVSLSSQDDLSGVQRIQYILGNEAETDYGSPITVPNEGQYSFSYWSIDEVNNQELPSPLFLIVDNTAPEIMTVFSIAPLEERDEEGVNVKIFPVNTSLYLTARDNSANIRTLEFSVNDEPLKPYTETLFFDTPGRFRIVVQASDNVQNVSSEVTEFRIVPR